MKELYKIIETELDAASTAEREKKQRTIEFAAYFIGQSVAGCLAADWVEIGRQYRSKPLNTIMPPFLDKI